MALLNPSFEDEDAVTGLAEFWAVVATGSDDAADYAGGAGAPTAPFESFRAGWDTNESFVFGFDDPPNPGQLEASIYEPGVGQETVEDFEEAWDNVPYFFAMGVTSPASYDGNTATDSGTAEPWTVSVGDTLDVTTDEGSVSSDPVAATEAYLQAANTSAGPPIGFDAGGETVRIYFNNRAFVAVTFTPAQVDVAGVAGHINTQKTLQGYAGEFTAGIINPGGGFRLFLQSDIGGYDSEIRVVNVSHPDTWQRIGFSAAQIQDGAQGTGNVKLLDEATADDIAALVANTSAIAVIQSGVVALPDGRVRVWSDPGGTVRIDSSGALGTALGFTLDTVFGPALTPESVEDFEEGYTNEIQPDEGNLIPSGGAETWTPSNPLFGSTTANQLDPLGDDEAFLLTDFTAQGDRLWTGDQTGIGGDRLRCRLWVKKDTSAPNFCSIAVNFDSGALQHIRVYFDQRTGRGAVSTDTLLEEAMVVEAIPGWWRVDLLSKAGGVGDVGFELRAAVGKADLFPDAGPAVGTANSGITVYGPRITELGFVALEGFATSWADVDGVAAEFDTVPETFEDFAEGWLNDSFQFSMGATTAASYDGGPGGSAETTEDFEETIAPFAAVPDHTADTLTKNNHGLGNGQTVRLRADGGTLPAGLAPDTDYFVVNQTANTIQLSGTSGGSAINFTDNGTGQLIVTPSGSVFWIDLMATL